MRLVSGCLFLVVSMILTGCVSAGRPQPVVRTTPKETAHETTATIDAPNNSSGLGQTVSENSTSTSLTSRFTKLFSRQDSSDRMALPRNDQPPSSGASDGSQQELGRDF
jgi:hypothetical protein